MGKLAAKLLLLLAMVLMPLGMTAAPAAAAEHAAMASMPMEHCPEQAPQHGGKAGLAECTMACAAALPAADFRTGEPLKILCTPDVPSVAARLHGLDPETATPPPKRS